MSDAAHSTDNDLARCATAALDALYDAAHWGTFTISPDIEEISTALPGRSALSSPRPNDWAAKNVPVKFTSMTFRHWAAVTSTESPLISIPAAVRRICG